MKRALALLLTLTILVGLSAVSPVEAAVQTGADGLSDSRNKAVSGPADVFVQRTAEEASASSSALSFSEWQGKQALLWDEELEWVEWTFDIPESGVYNLLAEYCPVNDSGMAIRRDVQINGQPSADGQENIALDRWWQFEGEPLVNGLGDEVSPPQEEAMQWTQTRLMDGEGMQTRPLAFTLEAGVNTIRLVLASESVAIAGIAVISVESTRPYAQVQAEYAENGFTPAASGAEYEAEAALLLKNDSGIMMASDTDPAMSPANGNSIRMNMIGGWGKTGQTVQYRFTVPETGLYTLYLRDMAAQRDGIASYVTVRLDGEVPCDELWEYAFTHQNRWRTEALCADGVPMQFYLEKGEHTLSMRAVCGPLSDTYRVVYADYMKLTKLIRDIIMITGSEPDVNYDYEITTSIPDIVSRLEEMTANMRAARDAVQASANKASTLGNQMESVAGQLAEMAKKPDSIPRRLTDLQGMTSTYASVVESLKGGGMSLDKFWAVPAGETVEDYRASVWEKIAAFFRTFILSFVKDYNAVSPGSEGAEEYIEVWISRGKEWGEIIERMADTYFTPQENIGVQINILPTGQLSAGGINAIMLAIAAGNAPDAALGVAGTSPFEYAIRGAAVDLSQLDGFDEVYTRFNPELLVPLAYNGGYYALPETQNTRVMYYRTDIFEELGLEPPDTWEEMYNVVMPLLYKNGMQVCIPAVFDLFLYQNGGEYYTEDGLSSALDSEEAFVGFSEMIELYTDYGVPVTMNFFNRFRTGEAPIGIDTLSSYMTFKMAAPEITGRWEIAPVPGRVEENGEINRSAGGLLMESCLLLADSDKQEAGWKFLKWWTADDTQTRFEKELESRMGVQARWMSANQAAFDALPWSKSEKAALSEAMRWGKEMPMVIGGYFTGRHINNAYNRCVVDKENPRDSLEKCVEDINLELVRRQKDFHIG